MPTRKAKSAGGFASIVYSLRRARAAGGIMRLYRALRSRNACKTCALGMGGQKGGMVNERGVRLEVCKKSIQAMTADLQGRIPATFFSDNSIERMRRMTSRELEAMGRLVSPVIRRQNDSRFQEISWDDAFALVVDKLKATKPDDSFFYFSGRSSNEAGFLLQLFARLYGTNNVNNCSYYCHQASGVGLKEAVGSGTATVVLDDIDRSDLVFIIGANPASNHPRLMKSLMKLRRRGGKVIVINPLREAGLERFSVPSDPLSLLFGSRIADLFIQPNIGGDIALLHGIAKAVMENESFDRTFVENHSDGWQEFRDHISAMDWDEIVSSSGVTRATIEEAARLYGSSDNAIFCWAMGITHHVHGVDNVRAIANLAMVRGMLGKPGSGLLPLRGHSNVQGIGSMGVVPNLTQPVLSRLEGLFETRLPTSRGRTTLECMNRAHEGQVRVAFCLGGNLYGSNPDSSFAARALGEIDLVVYLSTTLNTGHTWGVGKDTLILPVLPRDEESESTTQESMFNYVRLSDGGKPRHEGLRSEVDIIASIAGQLFVGDSNVDWNAMRKHRNIRDVIARVIPGYAAIGRIDESKEEFQIEGRTFHRPRFNTPSGKAQFACVAMPQMLDLEADQLRLMTIRSEGQFNTVVYDEDDAYRGQDRRDIIMMNAHDIAGMGLREDQRVSVEGSVGTVENVLVREFDVPRGNAAMYYPEANVLIPKAADERSGTPAFKNATVRIAVAAPASR